MCAGETADLSLGVICTTLWRWSNEGVWPEGGGATIGGGSPSVRWCGSAPSHTEYQY